MFEVFYYLCCRNPENITNFFWVPTQSEPNITKFFWLPTQSENPGNPNYVIMERSLTSSISLPFHNHFVYFGATLLYSSERYLPFLNYDLIRVQRDVHFIPRSISFSFQNHFTYSFLAWHFLQPRAISDSTIFELIEKMI